MTTTREPAFHEPTWADLMAWLWEARLWVVTGIVAGLVAAIVWFQLAIPQYRVTMLVGPTTRTGTPDISSLFPANASYAMEYVLRSFGPADSSDFMRFEAILRGPSVSALLLDYPALIDGMAKARRWSVLGDRDLSSTPLIAAYLDKAVRIDPVGHTPMRRVTYDHHDPVFAERFLTTLYVSADTIIRQDIQKKTSERITWLQRTLNQTRDPDHRRMLTELLSEQEQVRMLLSLNEPFAAIMAEQPSLSAKPVWPERKIIFPMLVLAGAFCGFMLFRLSGRSRYNLTARFSSI